MLNFESNPVNMSGPQQNYTAPSQQNQQYQFPLTTASQSYQVPPYYSNNNNTGYSSTSSLLPGPSLESHSKSLSAGTTSSANGTTANVNHSYSSSAQLTTTPPLPTSIVASSTKSNYSDNNFNSLTGLDNLYSNPSGHLPSGSNYSPNQYTSNKSYTSTYQQQQSSTSSTPSQPAQQSNSLKGATMLPPLAATAALSDPYFNYPKSSIGSQYNYQQPQLPNQQLYQISGNNLSNTLKAIDDSTHKALAKTQVKKRRRTTHNPPDPKNAVTYPCQTCGKVFYKAYNLKSHMKTHSDEKPFACKYCQKAFARSHDRRRHERLHEDEKKFKCSGVLSDGISKWGCGKRFARADALGRHFRTETGFLCIGTLVNDFKEMERANPGSIAAAVAGTSIGGFGASSTNFFPQNGAPITQDQQFGAYPGLIPSLPSSSVPQQKQQQFSNTTASVTYGLTTSSGGYRVQSETEALINSMAREAALDALLENRKF